MRNKTPEVIQEIERLHQNIIALTETKKKGKSSEDQGSYIHLLSGVEKHKQAQRGISKMIKKKLKKYITSWEGINQKIINMNIKKDVDDKRVSASFSPKV